jgi:hypothetical protein
MPGPIGSCGDVKLLLLSAQDEILGWNKALMAVADVNQIMSEIQRTWSYLESLFIAR